MYDTIQWRRVRLRSILLNFVESRANHWRRRRFLRRCHSGHSEKFIGHLDIRWSKHGFGLVNVILRRKYGSCSGRPAGTKCWLKGVVWWDLAEFRFIELALHWWWNERRNLIGSIFFSLHNSVQILCWCFRKIEMNVNRRVIYDIIVPISIDWGEAKLILWWLALDFTRFLLHLMIIRRMHAWSALQKMHANVVKTSCFYNSSSGVEVLESFERPIWHFEDIE